MTDAKAEAMDYRAGIVARALRAGVRETHGRLASFSHVAALAADRLEAIMHGDPAFRVAGELAAVRDMLRTIAVEGREEYLRQHGGVEDYDQLGAKVVKRYRTPGGRWKAAPRQRGSGASQTFTGK